MPTDWFLCRPEPRKISISDRVKATTATLE
jgi:hypothetical protein